MSEHKIVHPPFYFAIFALLVGLTGLTVFLGEVNLGAFHTIVGLAVATTKASLIVLFFMHVLHGSRFVWLILASTILFLAILLIVTATDNLTRNWQT